MDDRMWDRLAASTTRPGKRPHVSVILPELLVGEYPLPDDVVWLRDEHRVSAVLSLQDDADLACKDLSLRELAAAYRAASIRFDRLPIGDGDAQQLAACLDDAVARLERWTSAGEAVYLHCNAGMNRAPTIAIAFLHVHRGQSLAAARDHVKARRACVPYWRVLVDRYGE
jgi:atypical dual specificity phosphatase